MGNNGIDGFVSMLGVAAEGCDGVASIGGAEYSLTPIIVAVKHTCAIVSAREMLGEDAYQDGREALEDLIEGIVFELMGGFDE